MSSIDTSSNESDAETSEDEYRERLESDEMDEFLKLMKELGFDEVHSDFQPDDDDKGKHKETGSDTKDTTSKNKILEESNHFSCRSERSCCVKDRGETHPYKETRNEFPEEDRKQLVDFIARKRSNIFEASKWACKQLNEINFDLMYSVISHIGFKTTLALIRQARAVEAAGGAMTKDEKRRRTTGGIFFSLAGEIIPAETFRTISRENKKRMRSRLAAQKLKQSETRAKEENVKFKLIDSLSPCTNASKKKKKKKRRKKSKRERVVSEVEEGEIVT